MHLSPDPWVWIASLLSLCIFSFLYRDNPFYRVAEHVFVGVSNGYFIAMIWHNVVIPDIYKPLKLASVTLFTEGPSWSLINPAEYANFVILIPTLIGALYVSRFIPKISWMVRIPIALTMGYYSAAAIMATMEASVIEQISATILKKSDFRGLWAGICTAIGFLGVFATLYHFYFSRKDDGVSKQISRIGIIYVMIGFGASFGLTVMGRVALAIGRIVFLLKDWLGIVQ